MINVTMCHKIKRLMIISNCGNLNYMLISLIQAMTSIH